ncbi:MAG TPA: hypothetical protein VES01_07945 [Dermatophilaceae bacterium]|nr:hypothetical protein [Dermatophilaceae bacterium]
MKKALVGGALIVGLGLFAKRFGARMFENLPDDAPPKWMFRNIAAIRENTDRILEILDQDRRATEDSSAAVT